MIKKDKYFLRLSKARPMLRANVPSDSEYKRAKPLLQELAIVLDFR